VPTDQEWASAFETSKLRADYELSVCLGTDDLNGDDEFYADLAGLSERHVFARLDALTARGVKIRGAMPQFEVLPPFERRHRRPMRLRPVGNGSAKREFGVDELRDISSDDFYEALTGLPAGGRVSCPAPDHQDDEPACSLGEGGLWNCFACSAGGTIYEMAAYVWGFPLPLRGREYGEVRDRLKEMFGVKE
jgi:hypothetical protein